MTTIVDRPSEPLDAAVESLPRPTSARWVFAGAAIAVATGVALRFLLGSYLWLDEALTVEVPEGAVNPLDDELVAFTMV